MDGNATTRAPINPGPAATPGSNDRRVGAPNHHQQSGSGENTMVDTTAPKTGTAWMAVPETRWNALLVENAQLREALTTAEGVIELMAWERNSARTGDATRVGGQK